MSSKANVVSLLVFCVLLHGNKTMLFKCYSRKENWKWLLETNMKHCKREG